jgi:hypothetical protein
MSSYASYCQDQATDCALRARLASSPEIVAYCRSLEFRWLRLAEQAQETGGALGHESGLAATVFPLRDKTARYPVEYGKRAGELIARAARSLHQLHPSLRQKKRIQPAVSGASSTNSS